jgi:SAM-dependent MidA family methyltransferase
MAAASNHNLPIALLQALAPIEQQAISQQLAQLIQQKIKNAGGWISFAEFMQMALYAPGLGYYAGGAQKFGMAGDFVTAPEISPLFAQTIALQAMQVLAVTQGNVLELGAGTGKLAVDLLLELEHLKALPEQYFILEVSAYLRQVQRETCQKKLPAELFEKIIWLETLPKTFSGFVFGNEVLDAIPAHIVHKTLIDKNTVGWYERGVGFDSENNEFVWKDAELSQPDLAKHLPADLPVGYITEVNPAASGLVRSLAEMLETGAILLIDYGFGAAEYYHPQRNQGTLMCHCQQLAHDNPLINIGLQDITAHVDFTSIAMLCEPTSMRLAGYANQAQFLINCGILTILQRHSVDDVKYMQLAAAAQKLLSPAEMGELFKVICFTKNIDEPLIGFAQGDKAYTL